MGHNLTPTKTSAGAGNWNTAGTWTPSGVPGASDVMKVIHAVALDTDTTVAGLLVDTGGTLTFSAGTSRTVQSTANVVVAGSGKIVCRPSSAAVIHKIQFNSVSEAGFVGSDPMPVTAVALQAGTTYRCTVSVPVGRTDLNLQVGDQVTTTDFTPAGWNVSGKTITVRSATTFDIDVGSNPSAPSVFGKVKPAAGFAVTNDIGLWCIDSGVLDFVGTSRAPTWTSATTGLTTADNSVTVADAPSTWQVNDEVVITPTAASDTTSFDVMTIQSVAGSVVTFTATLPHNHPAVSLPDGTTRYAEVGNLTRNVIIQGQDATHRAHNFIRNTAAIVQTISYVLWRFLGPRQSDGHGSSEPVVGRWPNHFHDGMDNNSGSVVDGAVVRDSGSYAFVSHMSNGITHRNCIAYATDYGGFWWDLNDLTDNTLWDHCLAANITAPVSSRGELSMQAFQLGFGITELSNEVKNCTAVGVQGKNNQNAGGFGWAVSSVANPVDEPDNSAWKMTGTNVSHNNQSLGLFFWVVGQHTHNLTLIAYRNGRAGILAGSYGNVVQYRAGTVLYDNGWSSTNNPNRAAIIIDATSQLVGTRPAMVQSAYLDVGASTSLPAVKIRESFLIDAQTPHQIVDCTFLNSAGAQILCDEITNEPAQRAHLIDFVRTKVGGTARDLASTDFSFVTVKTGTTLRVQLQDDSGGFQWYSPDGVPANVQLTTDLAPFALAVATQALPAATQNVAYSQTLTATANTSPFVGPYTWDLAAGSLPAGLTLSSGGVISGTPTTQQTASFSVRATDPGGVAAIKALAITVNAAAVLTISTSSVPNCQINVAYSTTILATGGTSPYTWAKTGGNLPAGLSLAANGVLSGTPTQTGTKSFTVRVTDNVGATASVTLSITSVNPLSLPASTLTPATAGVSYSDSSIHAINGTSPYTYAVISGSLPTGLSLNASTAAITGTPTVPGTSNFTIRATDNVSATATQAFSLAVASGALILNGALPNGSVSQFYTGRLTASDGQAPYTWGVDTGTVPAGLILVGGQFDQTNVGTLWGIPTTQGAQTFVIRVTDVVGATTTRSFTVTISAALPPPVPAKGRVGSLDKVPVGSGPGSLDR